jgi:hypothetical protein
LVPYNVSITLVTDSTTANFVLDANTTSASGDMTAGVLGCFNPDNSEITMIEGWNWYAGADPTQIGAGQYDFETTVMHEFGHALGLGGSSDTNSPMYETLPTATVRRTITVADLNIPYPPDGADPLTAVGFRFKGDESVGTAAGSSNGSGTEPKTAVPQANEVQYLLFTGVLQNSQPAVGNRDVAAPAVANLGLLPNAPFGAGNNEIRSNLDKFGGRISLAPGDALYGEAEALSGPQLGEFGTLMDGSDLPTERGPNSPEAPQDDRPAMPGKEKPAESINALPLFEASTAHAPEEPQWFVGSLNGPIGESGAVAPVSLEALDARTVDVTGTPPVLNDTTEFLFVAAAVLGIPAVVAESEKNGAERPVRKQIT